MILGMYILFEERNRLVDFPYPFLRTSGSIMMSVNNNQGHSNKGSYRLTAILKPFQWQVLYCLSYLIHLMKYWFVNIDRIKFGLKLKPQVWMWMGISILLVPIIFYGLSRCLSYIRHKRNPVVQESQQQQLQTSPDREYRRFESVIIYILSINLLQCEIYSKIF